MTVRGKVKGNVVMLEKGASLPDGARVEIRIVKAAKSRKKSGTNVERPEPWKTLLKFAGFAKGLPSDFAENHDHYIHGTPKRTR